MTQVPTQSNYNDCGCYAIYFAKQFLARPDATLALIKVISIIFYVGPQLSINTRLNFLHLLRDS